MKVFLFIALVLVFFISINSSAKNKTNKNNNITSQTRSGDKMKESAVSEKTNISDIVVTDMEGKKIPLSNYKGKTLLIVNVASECSFTQQYKGLEAIYKKYHDKGFEILAFPCNQFGGQEPGTNEQIKQFCSTKYDVTFKLFDKIDVNGKNRTALYKLLTNNDVTGSGDIGWNFEKFLISKDGNIIARYPSKVEPTSDKIVNAIEEQLNK
jgi:glutathione peroxidase